MLADLQTASGKDAHSISVDPTFNSATDLHTLNAFLDDAGTTVAGITDDIDGETRSATTPDIGADEFSSCTLEVDAGLDETTYFGSPGDQTVVRTATVSGGTPPFSYSWTLDRPLLCNQVTADGDEQFFGGTCTNNSCPTTGSPTGTALCSGSASITAVLMDTASICVTVIDANGCMASDCFTVNASDVRCFAGNSGNQKVLMCHHTNSPNNPWVEICVDSSAVAAHLAQGDYLGPCNPDKMALAQDETYNNLNLKLFPNPTKGFVTIAFDSETEHSYIINLVDIIGRNITSYSGNAIEGENETGLNLGHIESGLYQVIFTLDGNREVKKLIIE